MRNPFDSFSLFAFGQMQIDFKSSECSNTLLSASHWARSEPPLIVQV
jgi:hypothetical protein